jgi:selenocysteine lyase/cysteine desulfurase
LFARGPIPDLGYVPCKHEDESTATMPPAPDPIALEFDAGTYRDDTPAAVGGRIHLNNAGAALQPKSVIEAVVDYLNAESAQGGYETADDRAASIASAYDHVASLIGAHARNVAVVENATVAFSLALSAFDFSPGDVILTTRNDYISNQLAYLSLAERQGVRVVRAEDAPEGGVDPDSVRDLVRREKPKLVAVTWVPTNSGLIQPVEAVGGVCADAGVPYLIDACQALGQVPIDVERLKCDFLSATARKFLRGPRGVGFLYVSDAAIAADRRPLYIDMRGAEWVDDDEYRLTPDARRFENWEFAYALLPCIAGHVGADTAGVILSESPHKTDKMTLVVDVGTNAESVLGNRDRLLACSSPTGPAFEGAQISCGQRAAPGAIERVRIDPETLEPRFKVIGSDLWSNEEGFAQGGMRDIFEPCGSWAKQC